MICKYTVSKYFAYSCPTYTGITGAELSPPAYVGYYRDIDYTVSNTNATVSGSGYYQSYLNTCDANQGAEAAALSNISGLASTGCLYTVNLLFTGACDPGSLNTYFSISVSKTGHNPYLTYLEAFLEATGMMINTCNTP